MSPIWRSTGQAIRRERGREGARARGGKTCGSENCERASSTRSEPLLLLYCNMSAAACCGGTPRPSSSDGVHGSSVNLVQRDGRARAGGAENGRMGIRTPRTGAGAARGCDACCEVFGQGVGARSFKEDRGNAQHCARDIASCHSVHGRRFRGVDRRVESSRHRRRYEVGTRDRVRRGSEQQGKGDAKARPCSRNAPV